MVVKKKEEEEIEEEEVEEEDSKPSKKVEEIEGEPSSKDTQGGHTQRGTSKNLQAGDSGEPSAEPSSKDDSAEPQLTDLPGIGPAVSAKLENAGVTDLMGLAVMGPAQLGDAAGLSPAVARKAIQAARNMLKMGFVDGLEYAERREDVLYITTGSKSMNDLLGGKGIQSRAVTEAYGAYGSGKTQLGSTLAVNAQLPVERGGANGKCVFIDTEGTFRPARIKQIAESLGANPEKVLKNIFVARAFNSDHQILLLDKISEMIKEGEPIKLLIVDSLTAHFRAEFAGRGQLADRQQKLNKFMHNLTKLAEQHNLAVYVTNQVMANPAQMFGDPTTAIGGHIVGHASTYRIYLRRGKKDSRVAKLVDSPDLPDNEAIFFLSNAGVIDE